MVLKTNQKVWSLMLSSIIRKALLSLTVITFVSVSVYDSAYSVTQYKKGNLRFTSKLEDLKTSLELPTSDSKISIKIPVKKLRIRANKGKPNEKIEPLSLYLSKDQSAISQLTKKLAKSGKKRELLKTFIKKLRDAGPTNKDRVKIYISKDDFKLINPSAMAKELAKDHQKVIINSKKLRKDPALKNKFIRQLDGFLSSRDRKRVLSKINKGRNLNVEKELLPDFARKMIRKFLVYRGPNCFHAALAFHGQKLTRSKFVNIKEEKGYHRAMINYDELWRIVNRDFYEVDTKKHPLQYGDMLMFFNVPKEPFNQVSFRWIRHTATYLFGNYTFSKGSKSPNTPYTIKTLDSEWKTWQDYTSNLGVKVFRRNSTKRLKPKPSKDLMEWIY